MEQIGNLSIIGSSHISKESIQEIRSAFAKNKPDIVAVELDRSRAASLLSPVKGRYSVRDIGRVGLKGFAFAVLGSYVSKKLGQLVGVNPGEEMKTAMLLAQESKIQIALIDRDIQITLKRFSASLSWKERWHFVEDFFNAMILRKKDPLLNFDLSKVPEKRIIQLMIGKLRVRYPNIYNVIIKERNFFMARKLKRLIFENPEKKILAVLGAGHVDELVSILKENEGISYSFTFGQ